MDDADHHAFRYHPDLKGWLAQGTTMGLRELSRILDDLQREYMEEYHCTIVTEVDFTKDEMDVIRPLSTITNTLHLDEVYAQHILCGNGEKIQFHNCPFRKVQIMLEKMVSCPPKAFGEPHDGRALERFVASINASLAQNGMQGSSAVLERC